MGKVEREEKKCDDQEQRVQKLGQALAPTALVGIVEINLNVIVRIHVGGGPISKDAWLPCLKHFQDGNKLHYQVDNHADGIERLDEI